MQTDRSLEVGQVVLETRLLDLVVLETRVGETLPRTSTEPVECETLDPVGDLLVLGRQRTALTRRNVLRRIERVGGEVAVSADLNALPLGADGVSGILDQGARRAGRGSR